MAQDVDSYRVFQAASAKIKKAGLRVPQQPLNNDGEPIVLRLNAAVVDMDNVSLGKLLVDLSALCDYAAYAAAVAEINLSVETAVFEFVRAKVRIGKSGKVHESRDKTNIDPRFIEAQSQLLEKQAIATLTKVLVENYQRDWQTVSREITRRGQESERI